MRGIRFAFLIAVLTRRAFFIDWPSSSGRLPLPAVLQPALLDWTLPPGLVAHMPHFEIGANDSSTRDHLAWHRGLKLPSATLWPEDAVDLRNEDVTGILNKHAAVTTIATLCAHSCLRTLVDNKENPKEIARAFGSGKNGSIRMARKAMHMLFTPSSLVKRRAHARKFQQRREFISVHLRTGLDVGESHLRRFATFRDGGAARGITQGLLRCTEEAIRREGIRRQMLFVSDSSRYDRWVFDMARSKGWKVKVAKRQVMHVSRMATRMRTANDAHGKCQRFVDVFADLVALSRGVALVGTRSGFVETAFLMGRARRKYKFIAEDGSCLLDENVSG